MFAMLARTFLALALLAGLIPVAGLADDNRSLGDRTKEYLTGLLRLDTANPPGNETRVAEYLKQVADAHGIPAEILGAEPRRMNFVARLKGSGKGRPLVLMAHSDVVPADRSQWSADPFGGELKNGYIYGRGAMDTKSLLAAEMAVMVEIKRRNLKLTRDLILIAEADEQSGSTGIQWLIQHAAPKIDAESAINLGGAILETKDGTRIYEVQTAEKIPMRIVLTARGVAGTGSLPLPDNPVLHLARAVVKLSDAEQPVRFNATTRRYMRELAKLADYAWLAPLVPRLENPVTSASAAAQIRARDPDLDAMLHTTVTPTMLRAGLKINVVPNTAEAQMDVRRMPSEMREDVLARFRQIINDATIEVSLAPGPQMPTTEPSPLTSVLYKAIEHVVESINPHDAVVLPVMSRGANDGSFLRARGVAVYGAPVFVREGGENRPLGNDERISTKNVEDGVELLWQIVLAAAGEN